MTRDRVEVPEIIWGKAPKTLPSVFEMGNCGEIRMEMEFDEIEYCQRIVSLIFSSRSARHIV